jgi:hypothetical protein
LPGASNVALALAALFLSRRTSTWISSRVVGKEQVLDLLRGMNQASVG